jgi:aconitase A
MQREDLSFLYILSSHASLFKCRFDIVGYGCSTCVGNTAPLSEAVLNAVKQVKM